MNRAAQRLARTRLHFVKPTPQPRLLHHFQYSTMAPSVRILSKSTLSILLLALMLKPYWGSQDEKSGILAWADKSGEFKRKPSAFRNWISKEPGAEFPPEKDRYHLYVSYACPWGESRSTRFPQDLN